MNILSTNMALAFGRTKSRCITNIQMDNLIHIKEQVMFSSITIKRCMLAMSIIFAIIVPLSTAKAAETAQHPEGTMGAAYQANDNQKSTKESSTKMRSADPASAQEPTQQGQRVIDISEWQGDLTSKQVKALKKNNPFIIIRAQYGSEREDASLKNNIKVLENNNLDYGVYSYSMYENPDDARYEAKQLYDRAPNASFYVNDFEENAVKSGTTEETTSAWYDEMKSLAKNKKVLFYSNESFMLENAQNALDEYDGYWFANYSKTEADRPHVLWQYTDSYDSPELGQKVDANYIGPNVNADWFTS